MSARERPSAYMKSRPHHYRKPGHVAPWRPAFVGGVHIARRTIRREFIARREVGTAPPFSIHRRLLQIQGPRLMICLRAWRPLESSNPVFILAGPQAYVSWKKTSRLPEAVDRLYCCICLVAKLFGLQNNSTVPLFHFIAQKCYVVRIVVIVVVVVDVMLQICASDRSAMSVAT